MVKVGQRGRVSRIRGKASLDGAWRPHETVEVAGYIHHTLGKAISTLRFDAHQ